MAPNILNQKKQNENFIKKDNTVQKKILEFQKFIEKNKARSLHYNNNKHEKGIYGKASKKQIKELKDEGIDTYVFPWIENKNN